MFIGFRDRGRIGDGEREREKKEKGGRREWRQERRMQGGRHWLETLISCLCTCPKWGLNVRPFGAWMMLQATSHPAGAPYY